jgi:hypothetical protein
MIPPIDLSDEPPLRDISFSNVLQEFGEISSFKPGEAYDVLVALCSPHWLESGETDAVFLSLISKAEIRDDCDELENLGLERFCRE